MKTKARRRSSRRRCAFVVCKKAAGQRRQHRGYCHAHYTNIYASSSLLFCVHTHNRSSSAVAKSNRSPLTCHSSAHWALGDQHTLNSAGGYRHHLLIRDLLPLSMCLRLCDTVTDRSNSTKRTCLQIFIMHVITICFHFVHLNHTTTPMNHEQYT